MSRPLMAPMMRERTPSGRTEEASVSMTASLRCLSRKRQAGQPAALRTKTGRAWAPDQSSPRSCCVALFDRPRHVADEHRRRGAPLDLGGHALLVARRFRLHAVGQASLARVACRAGLHVGDIGLATVESARGAGDTAFVGGRA